jgi:hypothetical protein
MVINSTNTTATDEETYYRVKFANVSYEVYQWATSAKAAAWDALDELLDSGYPEPLGAAAIRPAVYKEWNNSTWRYQNGGNFIHDLTPCNECSTPISTEVHREELGLCLECSNKFWSHDD